MKHSDSCFSTLTYDESHLPKGGTLVKEHPQKWLRRLRKILAPEKVRFFLVGEYGDQSWRPHYHVALFGVSRLVAGGLDGCGGVVQQTWDKGYTYTGDLTPESGQYIAGYTLKKMTRKEDVRLQGREPEFARMSLRPGIGAPATVDVARVLSSDFGLEELARNGDVPGTLRHGKRDLPLGRYLRRQLRGEMGFGSKDAPEEAYKRYALEMRVLYEGDVALPENASKTLGKIIVDREEQKCRNVEARCRIYDARRSI